MTRWDQTAVAELRPYLRRKCWNLWRLRLFLCAQTGTCLASRTRQKLRFMVLSVVQHEEAQPDEIAASASGIDPAVLQRIETDETRNRQGCQLAADDCAAIHRSPG